MLKPSVAKVVWPVSGCGCQLWCWRWSSRPLYGWTPCCCSANEGDRARLNSSEQPTTNDTVKSRGWTTLPTWVATLHDWVVTWDKLSTDLSLLCSCVMAPTPIMDCKHKELSNGTHIIKPTSSNKSCRKDTSEIDGARVCNFYHCLPCSDIWVFFFFKVWPTLFWWEILVNMHWHNHSFLLTWNKISFATWKLLLPSSSLKTHQFDLALEVATLLEMLNSLGVSLTPWQRTNTYLCLTVITGNNISHDPQCCSHNALVIMPKK